VLGLVSGYVPTRLAAVIACYATSHVLFQSHKPSIC